MSETTQELAADEAREIAELAFLYGFPMVVGYSVMYQYSIDRSSPEYKSPFNQIFNTARVYTPQDTAAAAPNSDTPYSFVWVDLRAEPVVVSVPKVEEGRYYSVQMSDLYTFNYAYVGSRSTGNEAQTFMKFASNPVLRFTTLRRPPSSARISAKAVLRRTFSASNRLP